MFMRLFTVLSLAAVQAAAAPYIVSTDRGGDLADRLREIEHILEAGLSVQIRGRVCYSTCTMFLGLPGTCVTPGTVFGFHGPSRGGHRLAPAEFEYFSRVIASYYPRRLADWFMARGRHKIRGVYKLRGADLIRQGLATACV